MTDAEFDYSSGVVECLCADCELIGAVVEAEYVSVGVEACKLLLTAVSAGEEIGSAV